MIAGIPTGTVRFALTSGGRSGSTLLQDQITLMKLTNQDYKGNRFPATSGFPQKKIKLNVHIHIFGQFSSFLSENKNYFDLKT